MRTALARRNARDAVVAEQESKAVREGRQAEWGGGWVGWWAGWYGGPGRVAGRAGWGGWQGGMVGSRRMVGGGWIFGVKNVLE